MTTTEPRTPSATRPGLVLLVVSAAVFLASLDLFIVNVAFPELSRSLDASTSALSWVLNGYTITFAALLAPAGRIADRIGRRRVFLAGLVIFSRRVRWAARSPGAWAAWSPSGWSRPSARPW